VSSWIGRGANRAAVAKPRSIRIAVPASNVIAASDHVMGVGVVARRVDSLPAGEADVAGMLITLLDINGPATSAIQLQSLGRRAEPSPRTVSLVVDPTWVWVGLTDPWRCWRESICRVDAQRVGD